MKKKLTKIQKLKNEIVVLKKKLDDKDTNYAYLNSSFRKTSEKLEEKEKFIKDCEGAIDVRLELIREENRKLLEIIRWNVKPSTAEHPFMPSKNELSERPNGGNYPNNTVGMFQLLTNKQYKYMAQDYREVEPSMAEYGVILRAGSSDCSAYFYKSKEDMDWALRNSWFRFEDATPIKLLKIKVETHE